MPPVIDSDPSETEFLYDWERSENPGRRGELSQRGRVRALEFAWPQVTERVEGVYFEALESRAARS